MNYIITGRVIKGDGYGRKIGFPTINLNRRNFLRMKKKPTFGVYAGKVSIMSNTRCLTYRAGVVIGPLDKKGLPKIEAHLLGFKGDAYGRSAVLTVEKFLRKFRKFKTEKELIARIKKDLKLVRRYFEFRNSSQAHFLKRLSQADEPRVSAGAVAPDSDGSKSCAKKEFRNSRVDNEFSKLFCL